MITDSVVALFNSLRLDSYQRIFSAVKDREGSLTATEAFSADVIHLLGEPTVMQFAEVIGVSQPNATYKINSLVAKGYVKKVDSNSDRRAVHIRPERKFFSYFTARNERLNRVAEELNEQFSGEELLTAERVMHAIAEKMNRKNVFRKEK